MLCETRCSLSHWQGHRLTLLCILDCAAHLLPMPEEVETSFLNQTIKVFTKVSINIRCKLNILRWISFFCSLQIDRASVKNESLYTTLKAILTPVFHKLCDRAVEESDYSWSSLNRTALTRGRLTDGGGFCSHFWALLYFKPVPHFRYCCQSFSLSRYAKTVSFEGLAFHFSWKLLIDSKHCHSLC